jgi:hypothetical protein
MKDEAKPSAFILLLHRLESCRPVNVEFDSLKAGGALRPLSLFSFSV